ncbi:VWA-like domain-containing protein [Variovorax sp. J22R133]|uniref:vWA domain-containing protein n=1 Tax=Variovorax brevis TaxID=3053503 RepID=UPI00257878C2|nr:VWA-like domain-containing protein [Variovorax sp. J22R133]MDM0116884.1 VWA-like domain-containing protein [Variovorax sp. J22R133]
MNRESLTQITHARSGLILDHGFFGMLALRLELKEMPEDMKARLIARKKTPTLAVDGKRVFYDPPFILSMTPAVTKSALAHEVMHCVFEHIGRRNGRNPGKWNSAGDYVINQVLEDSGFELGKGWLIEPAFKNMSADHIYSLLPDGDDGDDDSLCDVMDGDPADQDLQDVEWKVATVQAAQAAKAQGTLPDAMKRFIDELTAPQVNWREQLQRFVTQISKNDYSWMRPNKRHLSQGFYLPTLYSENMGVMAVAIDTSGSIDKPTLTAFGGEITAIHATVRPEKLFVIYCDARVNHVDEFGANDVLHFDMHGGGGTDFNPPFNWLRDKGHEPECLVYLTDMYGGFPSHVDFPVLWCATTDVKGPIGETIRIKV